MVDARRKLDDRIANISRMTDKQLERSEWSNIWSPDDERIAFPIYDRLTIINFYTQAFFGVCAIQRRWRHFTGFFFLSPSPSCYLFFSIFDQVLKARVDARPPALLKKGPPRQLIWIVHRHLTDP